VTVPTAERNGAQIYYEVRGDGPPLVLLEGLGYGMWMWRGQVPTLEREFRLVLLDNRGVGRSSPLAAPYSIEEFARDALAVLDSARIDRAAVLGASMGGLIAQSMAALAPERISALILASTLPGGPESRPMPPETLAELVRSVPGETAAERLRRTMALALTPTFPRERAAELEAILTVRLAAPQPAEQWTFQAMSAREFDARASDARLAVPALVVTGTDDRVVPWTNSPLLYRLLPHASLALFRGQNHLVLIERSDEFNAVVARFLRSVASGTAPSGIEEVG
jgi:pimeloyl-ACP methyl ester carboxylesterase